MCVFESKKAASDIKVIIIRYKRIINVIKIFTGSV